MIKKSIHSTTTSKLFSSGNNLFFIHEIMFVQDGGSQNKSLQVDWELFLLKRRIIAEFSVLPINNCFLRQHYTARVKLSTVSSTVCFFLRYLLTRSLPLCKMQGMQRVGKFSLCAINLRAVIRFQLFHK